MIEQTELDMHTCTFINILVVLKMNRRQSYWSREKNCILYLQDAKLDTLDLDTGIDQWPAEVKEIVANLAFSKRSWLREFHQFKDALNADNWTQTALEMRDLCWTAQDCPRVKRLIVRMWNVHEKSKPLFDY